MGGLCLVTWQFHLNSSDLCRRGEKERVLGADQCERGFPGLPQRRVTVTPPPSGHHPWLVRGPCPKCCPPPGLGSSLETLPRRGHRDDPTEPARLSGPLGAHARGLPPPVRREAGRRDRVSGPSASADSRPCPEVIVLGNMPARLMVFMSPHDKACMLR